MQWEWAVNLWHQMESEAFSIYFLIQLQSELNIEEAKLIMFGGKYSYLEGTGSQRHHHEQCGAALRQLSRILPY